MMPRKNPENLQTQSSESAHRPVDVSKDPNLIKFREELPELLKEYKGEYAGYLDGQRVGINADPSVLLREIWEKHRRIDVAYIQILEEKDQEVLEFLSPLD